MTTTQEAVATLGSLIAQRIGEPRYRLWFEGNTQFTIAGQQLRVGVPNRFFQEWLANTFGQAVRDAAAALCGQLMEVEWVIDAELFQANRRKQAAAAAVAGPRRVEPQPPAVIKLPQRRWLQMENFVVGTCNRLAHAAVLNLAQGAAEPAGGSPMTLWGPVGVGKTHLLEGLHTHLRALGKEPVFLTAEEYTNRFLTAMRGNKLPAFRRLVRDCHALIVDNIQFFARKAATQEEFLHTIDALLRLDRPIALAADVHPKLLPEFAPELLDRLLGGGVWGLTPPDPGTREAILESKARQLGCDLPENVVHFLVEHLRGNVRELEGALHSIHHYSLVHGRPVTVELTRQAIGDLVRHGARGVRLQDVRRVVSRLFGVESSGLQSPARSRMLNHPRMLAMYISRQRTGASYKEIGRFFGGRNHSTAIAAEKRVEEWLAADATLMMAGQPHSVRDIIQQVEKELLLLD